MKTRWTVLALGMALCVGTCGSAWAQEDEMLLDPLGDVIVDMQVAGGRLSKLLTDNPTQKKQKDAVDKLDVLIKVLEQRRRQGRGNGTMPGEPLQDSMIVSGPGGSGPMHAARKQGAAWGQLPAHKREQILQSMSEGFPPHYQQILERYYRRLAEEKPADEAVDGAAASTGAALPAGATDPAATLAPAPAATTQEPAGGASPSPGQPNP
ncbi:MAG: hypothetical protein AB7O59_18045 [Pirellulales bacterium]